MNTAGRRRGFTLIELLVALAVFAVMSVFAYQGLRNFLVARSTVAAQNDALARVALGMTLLQQDVESAVPRPVRDALGDPEPALRGGRDGVEVLQLTRHTQWAPMAEETSDLSRIEYRLEQGKLIRRVWSVLDRVPDSTYAERSVLDNVVAVTVRYRQGDTWSEFWPASDNRQTYANLPPAVSITVDFGDGRRVERVLRIPGTG